MSAIPFWIFFISYIRTANAKGLGYNRIFFLHALKNASGPLLTVLGLSTLAQQVDASYGSRIQPSRYGAFVANGDYHRDIRNFGHQRCCFNILYFREFGDDLVGVARSAYPLLLRGLLDMREANPNSPSL